MTEINNNFRLIASYMLAQVSEEFLSCVDFNFKTIDNIQVLGKYIYRAYREIKDSDPTREKLSDPTFRKQYFFITIIVLIGRYLRQSTEQNMHEICDYLFHTGVERMGSIVTIHKLQYLACKKISNLQRQNILVSTEFNAFLENLVHPDNVPHYSIDDTLFTDQKFYEEVCQVIREEIYRPKSSLIHEVLKKPDVVFPADELPLIELINPFIKRQIKGEQQSDEEENNENVAPEDQVNMSASEHRETAQHKDPQPDNGRRRKKTPLKKRDMGLSINETALNIDDPMDVNHSPVRSVDLSLVDKPAQLRFNADELRDVVTQKSPKKSREALDESDLADNEDELDFNKSVSEPIRKTPRRLAKLSNMVLRTPETSPKKPAKAESTKNSSKKNTKRSKSTASFEVESFDESSESEAKTKHKNRVSSCSDEEENTGVKKAVARPKRMVSYYSDEEENTGVKKAKTKTSREKRKWSDLESTYLILGIQLYGDGKWSMIHSKFRLNFDGRTQVNLKDRWRTIRSCPTMLKMYEGLAKNLQKELKFSAD